MNQKELTETFIMILNWKKLICLRCFFRNYFSASKVNIFMYCLFQGYVGREAFGEQDVK